MNTAGSDGMYYAHLGPGFGDSAPEEKPVQRTGIGKAVPNPAYQVPECAGGLRVALTGREIELILKDYGETAVDIVCDCVACRASTTEDYEAAYARLQLLVRLLQAQHENTPAVIVALTERELRFLLDEFGEAAKDALGDCLCSPEATTADHEDALIRLGLLLKLMQCRTEATV